MEFLSPKINAEDVAKAQGGSSFSNTPVEAGDYEMIISDKYPLTVGEVRGGERKGEATLNVMLVHANTDLRKTAPAVFAEIPVGSTAKFAAFLLSAGYDAAQIGDAQWGRTGEVTEKGKEIAAVAINGDPIDLTSRNLRVRLTKEDYTKRDGTAGSSNRVKLFLS